MKQARSNMYIQFVMYVLLVSCFTCHIAATLDGVQVAGPQRSLQQDFGQFSSLLDDKDTFGGWGGNWVPTPTGPPAAALQPSMQQPNMQQSNPQAANQNGGVRPSVVRSIRNSPRQSTSNGFASRSSSGSSMGTTGVINSISPATQGGVVSGSNQEMGMPGAFTIKKAHSGNVIVLNPSSSAGQSTVMRGAVGNAGGIRNVNTGGMSAVNSGSGTAAAGANSNAAAAQGTNVAVNVNVPNAAQALSNLGLGSATAGTVGMADLSKNAGIINGVDPPVITDPAVLARLPRFNARNGNFIGGSDVAFWPSLNPSSRINAVFLDSNATKNIPPPDNVTVLDPSPINVTRVPTGSFESGYCVPRVAYLVVNVTALACVAGSNLTTWDSEPVCAKLDCSWRSPGTNVLNTPAGCRTVVERPKPICPRGCVVLEQWRWNATVNRTQLFTKCSCKAGNQPCPSLWTACTCYEGLNSRNLTRGFVVCSETQGECDRKCNLAVSGNPRLAPLCPVAMDPFLSINPTSPPIYPMFGWNMGSQAASQAATLGMAGRSLKQWVGGLGRRLTMAATGWQVHKVVASNVHAGATAGVMTHDIGGVQGSTVAAAAAAPGAADQGLSLLLQGQSWLQHVCARLHKAVQQWYGHLFEL